MSKYQSKFPIIKICEHCGYEFTANNSDEFTRRFCSIKCSNGRRKYVMINPIAKICEHCKNEFHIQKCFALTKRFCCRECSDKHKIGKLMINLDLDAFVEHYNNGLSMPDICTLLFIERDMFRKITKRLVRDGRIVQRERVKAWTYAKNKV